MPKTARYGRDKEHEEAIARAKEKAKKIHDAKKALTDDKFGLSEEETELPPLYNPAAKTNFSDEEIDALTVTDDDESIRLAFGKATPDEKELLKAKKAEGG